MHRQCVTKMTFSTRLFLANLRSWGIIFGFRQWKRVTINSSNVTAASNSLTLPRLWSHTHHPYALLFIISSSFSLCSITITLSSARIIRPITRSFSSYTSFPSRRRCPRGRGIAFMSWGRFSRAIVSPASLLMEATALKICTSSRIWSADAPESQLGSSEWETSSVMKAKFSRIMPMKRLSMMFSQTILSMTKKTRERSLPQSPNE
mmetsp:Transcript_23788/g.59701  ORF Transcript_23788/g.59701 Transcript_23788/m.59701 type:complete len:206 (+) Transcript_23788:1308-1925(+)